MKRVNSFSTSWEGGLDMSLFFEDEIRQAREKVSRLGLDDFMFQDPRSNRRTSRNKRRTSSTHKRGS